MDKTTSSRKKEIAVGLATLAIIILIVLAIHLTAKKTTVVSMSNSSNSSKAAAKPATSQSASTSTASPSTATTSTSDYHDGSYDATGMYASPGGEEGLGVKLTLKSGIVTASSVKSEAADPEAKQYQQQFISGYKKLVVGKSLDSIKVSRVAGSSLTSQGFNSALTQIKQQAKA